MSAPELWIILSTVIFVALIYKPAAKAITSGLDSRRARIVQTLDEAQKLRQEAEALLAETKKRHDSAGKEASDMILAAQEEAERLRKAAEDDLRRHIDRREKQATDRIAQAEAAALADIRNHAVDLALAASREVLAQRLAGEAADELADQVIASIPSRLSARR
jgi:F-type H+-transporting ATPase subunit b